MEHAIISDTQDPAHTIRYMKIWKKYAGIQVDFGRNLTSIYAY